MAAEGVGLGSWSPRSESSSAPQSVVETEAPLPALRGLLVAPGELCSDCWTEVNSKRVCWISEPMSMASALEAMSRWRSRMTF
jgi:hypothetical protein